MRAIYNSLILCLCVCFLAACGGGGGGGGGSSPSTPSTPKTDYKLNDGEIDDSWEPPNDKEIKNTWETPYFELEYIGQDINLENGVFTIELDNGLVIRMVPTGEAYGQPTFQPERIGKRLYAKGAAANEDAVIAGVVGYQRSGDLSNSYFEFGMEGNWTTFIPSNLSAYYFGIYYLIPGNASATVVYPFELYVDFSDLKNSYGQDQLTGEDVQLFLSKLEGRTLHGDVSDANGTHHSVALNVFGTNATTIAGGYATEAGVGFLLVEQ